MAFFHFSIFRKVVRLKFNFEIRFLDAGSVLQPVLFEVCLWYMAQYIMVSCHEERGYLEIQEEAQALLYIFMFVWALVNISHSISNAHFGIFLFLKLRKHINICDSKTFWNRIGTFVC